MTAVVKDQTDLRKQIAVSKTLHIPVIVFSLLVSFRTANAQQPDAVKAASSKQLYDEIVRRTTNVLAAPADTLKWSKLNFAISPKHQTLGAKMGANSRLASVYDDSGSNQPSSGTGPLTNVPDSVLSKELTDRTDNVRKTLYDGVDRRMDLYTAIKKRDDALKAGAPAVETLYVNSADAVGFILDAGLLRQIPSGDYYVSREVYGSANQLCKVENFWNEPCIEGIGTGFLVSANRLCTAGHCIPKNGDVGSLRVIFGYCLLAPQIPESIIINKEDVYSIKKVVRQRLTDDAEDWAVVELDHASQRIPLKLGHGHPTAGNRVFAIGYPSGLPLKIAPNASVRSGVGSDGCFLAAVDVCGGNSGSPVISEDTGEVEGILVRGGHDFRLLPTGACYVSIVINDAYRGESVCSISTVRPPPLQ